MRRKQKIISIPRTGRLAYEWKPGVWWGGVRSMWAARRRMGAWLFVGGLGSLTLEQAKKYVRTGEKPLGDKSTAD